MWTLGLQMTAPFGKGNRWQYPLYAGAGAAFGYWLDGVDARQSAVLEERKNTLLEKRARMKAREAEAGAAAGAH